MTVAEIEAAQTIGQIARRHGVPVHKVEYIILSRGIKPAGRAGRYRLFDAAAAEAIGRALEEIGQR